jgi:hypothetical protein
MVVVSRSRAWEASLQQDAVVAAVLTASVAVLAAVLSQVSTWTLEHHHRVYERRRSALLDVQDAALQVRGRLRDLGPAVRVAVERTEPAQQVEVDEDVRVSTARSDAEALLEVRLARVESGTVRDAVRSWQRAARFSFLGGDDDVTTADEELAWASMNATVGDALMVPGWWTTRLQSWRRRPVTRSRAPWR